MRRVALVLIAVTVAALVLTACGDSAPTKADYKKQFDPLHQQIKDLGSTVGDAAVNAEAKTDDELATQFSDLSTQTRAMADDVGKLEAPSDDIQSNEDALVNALREAARDLKSISAAAAAHNASAARAATIRLGNVTSPKITKAREAIEKQLTSS